MYLWKSNILSQSAARNKRQYPTVLQNQKLFRWMLPPALDFWDVVIQGLCSSNSTKPPTNPAAGHCSRNHKSKNKHKRNRHVDQLSHVTTYPQTRTLLKVSLSCANLKRTEAVTKMTNKGRNPTMRHVSRTHRVAQDWLFDRINLDPKIQIKYIDTKNQFADILTKGKFHT